MRRLGLAATAAVATAAALGASTSATGATDDDGQERFTFSSKIAIAPKKLGSPKRPRPTRLTSVVSTIPTAEEDWPPMLDAGAILVPRQIRLDGGNFPTCGKRRLIRRGPRACPPRSILGRSIDPVAEPPSLGFAPPPVLLVNGGERRLWAHSTWFNPAYFQQVVTIQIQALRHRRWSHRLKFDVPPFVLAVADPPAFETIRLQLGSKRGPRRYLTTAGRCPKRGLRYRFTARFLLNDGSRPIKHHRGRIPCR